MATKAALSCKRPLFFLSCDPGIRNAGFCYFVSWHSGRFDIIDHKTVDFMGRSNTDTSEKIKLMVKRVDLMRLFSTVDIIIIETQTRQLNYLNYLLGMKLLQTYPQAKLCFQNPCRTFTYLKQWVKDLGGDKTMPKKTIAMEIARLTEKKQNLSRKMDQHQADALVQFYAYLEQSLEVPPNTFRLEMSSLLVSPSRPVSLLE